ncbi:MAG TPA: GNAT family protein [Bacteroidales bacterium]|nr:GNAT family protein [Bacteroidales bacterium]
MNLISGNVKLRSFTENDAQRMAELANNEKISQNLRDGFPHPYTLNDARTFIKNCMNQNPITTFAIEYNGEHVGNVGLMPGQDVYRKSAEIGYFIGEPYWNKGIATIAINLITEYGFKDLGLVRIHAGVFEYNNASMHVLEKCGYERDAIFKKAIVKKNSIWDEYRYSKINLNC